MSDDLVTAMVPVLGRSLEPVFNVFDVMHHGVHEKQLSNVFRWLLKADGTHGLGDSFTRIFVEAVNRCTKPPLPLEDGYWVTQEVNTSREPGVVDIADLVLEGRTSVLVVENYFTSDGHGHCYDRYLTFAERDGKRGRVVLLCQDVQTHLQTKGWEHAAVVTHGSLIGALYDLMEGDAEYRRNNPDVYSFIQQMQRKFSHGGGVVDDNKVLDFVVAMCATGEARRYQVQSQEAAAEQFASDLAEQARERFGEGRDLLRRAKVQLRNHCGEVLVAQLNDTLGEGFVRGVSANYKGIYQWTINLDAPSLVACGDEARLQMKFGPSAWFANEQDANWTTTVDPSVVDYQRVFVTRSGVGEIRQSTVNLEEVLAGLDPSDRRLHDEIVSLLDDSRRSSAV